MRAALSRSGELVRPKLVAIKVSGCHLVPVICAGLELAYRKHVEAEGFDLSQDAVQRGLVQQPGEHGVRAVRRGAIAGNADSTMAARPRGSESRTGRVPGP